MSRITSKSLYQYVAESIEKKIKFSTSSPYSGQLERVSLSTTPGQEGASVAGIIAGIQELLENTLPQTIISGLEVEATTPISDAVIISSGKGSVGGSLYELDSNITLTIPFDNISEVFYIVLYANRVQVDKTYSSNKLTLAKIVVPNPGTTVYVQDDKDSSWNAYIVNFKEYKLYGINDKFEEDTLELMRDNIGDILADNIIGNIRLSENLKILNTAGTLELDSNSVNIYDSSENLLSQFNENGVYFYDTNGNELTKFTNSMARIGNISILPNALQSSNFVSGSIGFQLKDTGDVEFNNLIVRGTVYATAGEIGGWTIAANELYGTTTGTIKTSSTVGVGSNGVVLDYNGLRVYDDVLGLVVNLPSDGSAPSFASGIIQNTTFEINTNAVLRTSETVGDGSSSSAGILINNTGIYGCEANQLLRDANLKALIDGTVSLSGEITASSGTIGSTIITPTSLIGGEIIGATIRSALFETSASTPRVRIDTEGIYYQSTTNIGKYGPSGSGSYGFQYGDGTRYGSGVLAYLFHENLPILSVMSEQNYADFRLFNRLADPLSGTHELGDLICVNGRIKRCSIAGSPGTFADLQIDIPSYSLEDLTDVAVSSGLSDEQLLVYDSNHGWINKSHIDLRLVDTYNTQTINGTKTFSLFPVTPSSSPATSYEVANKKYVDDSLPSGVIVPYGGSSAPTGWLLCDGSAVSRTTYSTLFTAIGTAYGVGDSSTTFNVPNLKGKIPVGYNSAETEFDALGETGGEKTHTLTEAELASHAHVQGDSQKAAEAGSGSGNSLIADNSVGGPVSTATAGSGTAHNNLQPYVVANYIIKY